MKYKIGQTVTLLSTEFKPAYSAIIRNYNPSAHQYEVEFKYSNSSKTETIWVPQERLTLVKDAIQDQK